MSDTPTMTSATQTSPSSKDFAPCAGKCRWNVRVGTGFVPNVRRLFWLVRHTEAAKATPLTRTEVLSQEMCQGCAKRAGYETVTTADMLATMQGWAYENIQRKEDKLDRDAAFQQRQRERSLAFAIKGEDRSPINRLLATVKVEEKPRPKKRTHHHVAAAPHNGPKKFGDERKPVTDSGETKKKNNKKRAQQDQSGRKGKK